MRVPEKPPPLTDLLQKLPAARTLELISRTATAEIAGKYLHWEDLRHKPTPEGLTSEEWWFGVAHARSFLRRELPLADERGAPFWFAKTDGVERLLHRVDRELGSPLEVIDPRLANRNVRDRYLVSSLTEEAITSSQIEGASTTRRVAKEMLKTGRAPRSKDERMIANNFRAMEFVRENLSEPLSVELLLRVHRILTEGTLDAEAVGRLRSADDKVVVQDVGDGDVLHIPPPAEELQKRLAKLCAFANDPGADDDPFIHPVVRAIVLHFAIGYEHPFVDGNGRTARAVFYWSMLRQKYLLAEFLSISRVIQRGRPAYARAFLHSETDGGDLTYFLVHQLTVLHQAVQQLRTYLGRKAEELQQSERLIRAHDDLNHRQLALLADALRHPDAAYTIEMHRRENNVVYQTARQDLLDLAQAGLLILRKAGRTFTFTVPPDLERRLKGRGRAT